MPKADKAAATEGALRQLCLLIKFRLPEHKYALRDEELGNYVCEHKGKMAAPHRFFIELCQEQKRVLVSPLQCRSPGTV